MIPVDGLREGILAEVRPRPLAFFTEPIPVFGDWPDAPCGYVRLSEAYDVPLEAARAAGWPTRSIDGAHFDTVVEPAAVTDAMLGVMEEM